MTSTHGQPLVAVISPYYNRESVVRRTVESICQQTYRNLQILVWDDCSTDGTWREMQRVAAELEDPRLEVFRPDCNLGLTAGLNNAIMLCPGAKYVAIVGSGDECHPRRIEAQVRALEANPAAPFCATNSLSIDELSGEQFVDASFQHTAISEKDMRSVVPFTHGTVMYRRDAIVEVGLYERVFKWCADWDLFIRLSRTSHAVYLPEPYYTRYAMMDGVSFNPRKSVEQIECKYLVRKLASSDQESRADIIRAAGQDLPTVVSEFNADMARDLWKRQVKLIFMGRRQQAEELGRLIAERYGTSAVQKAGVLAARALVRTGISPSRLINAARGAARMARK